MARWRHSSLRRDDRPASLLPGVRDGFGEDDALAGGLRRRPLGRRSRPGREAASGPDQLSLRPGWRAGQLAQDLDGVDCGAARDPQAERSAGGILLEPTDGGESHNQGSRLGLLRRPAATLARPAGRCRGGRHPIARRAPRLERSCSPHTGSTRRMSASSSGAAGAQAHELSFIVARPGMSASQYLARILRLTRRSRGSACA